MLAAALVISLLGLAGTPPTIVFVGKLTTASAAWDSGLAWLAVAVFVNTLISLFYYLRWIVPVLKSDADASPPSADEGASSSPRPASLVVAVVAALGSLAMGIGAGLLWSLLTGA